jgi:malate synthase
MSIELADIKLDKDKKIFTNESINFIKNLSKKFSQKRLTLLNKRIEIDKKLEEGWLPDFLNETQSIRETDWKVATIPSEIKDRRIEITGPAERKMVINALNSGAMVFMADLEDSLSPTWTNIVNGQINLFDATRGTIDFRDPKTAKDYKLKEKVATLMVRPRGLHLEEAHVKVDGAPISASLFDFGMYFINNYKYLHENNRHIFFYIAKIENHLEARLWNEIFLWAQKFVNIPFGTIRTTVLIENILAVFEMEEILYELKDHILGLNCGRWDYIFSYIKKFRNNPKFILPERNQVTMDKHFLKSYSKLLINSCHKRGAYAMGGMSPFIPIKNDIERNKRAIEKVSLDKRNEILNGHDGTWVAHPGLIKVVKEIYDRELEGINQLKKFDKDLVISAEDLLRTPEGDITEPGIRNNINVCLLYIESWLRGHGCVPLYNLMEDAATAEIARAQLWQWLFHKAHRSNDRPITNEYVREIIDDELYKINQHKFIEKSSKIPEATKIFKDLIFSKNFEDFLTIPAYKIIIEK